MVFLHPEYLWGLIALIVPVIVHLFDFRKNRKVYFSDIRFLIQVKHASRKPLKLKQLLILFTRLGFIAFLVFAFAQPFFPDENGNLITAGTKLLYIDNSSSMTGAVNSNESALDKARSVGQEILEKLPQGQEIIVANNENITKFWMPKDVKEASDQVAITNYSDKSFSLPELGKAINQYNSRGDEIREVYLISDFQKSTFQMNSNALDTTVLYRLVPITFETNENCLIDSVYQIVSDITSNDQVQIGIIIKNTGSKDKTDLPVKVFLGERQVSASTVTVPAYQRKNMVFTLGKANNSEQGYIQIEDYPVSFDNLFYFAIPHKKLIHVLELSESNPSRYIKDVFGNKNVFSLEQGDWRSIDYSLLGNVDFIVLNQIEHPDIAFLQKIRSVSLNGIGVLVLPGYKSDISTYRELIPNLEQISSNMKALQPPEKNDPFFSNVLEASAGNIEMPKAKPVWSWGRDRSAILSFEDNTAYLSEMANNIFALSAPLTDSLSTLQTHALFVPVMYKLATHQSGPNIRLFNRTTDEFIDVDIDSANVRDVIKLKKGDLEIIPDKRKSGNRWQLTLPNEIISSGIYSILVNDVPDGFVAFNPDTKESQLEAFNQKDLDQLFQGYKYSILDTYDSGKKRISSVNDGIALWKYALIISLLFLLTEAFFIRFL